MYIIGGQFRGHRLVTPKTSCTRPTSSQLREAFFNITQSFMEGAIFLDLFAGSGAVGLEALSRGALSATLVERNKQAIECIEKNIASLGVQDRTTLFRGDALVALKKFHQQGKQFDIIYIDPPYNTRAPQSSLLYSVQMLQWVDTHQILQPNGYLFIEEDIEHQPQIDTLQTLSLRSSRRFGQSALQQYQYT